MVCEYEFGTNVMIYTVYVTFLVVILLSETWEPLPLM